MHMNASEKEVQGRARGHDSSNRRDAAKKMVADGGGVSKLLMTANKGNLPTIRKGEMQKLELKLGTARGARAAPGRPPASSAPPARSMWSSRSSYVAPLPEKNVDFRIQLFQLVGLVRSQWIW